MVRSRPLFFYFRSVLIWRWCFCRFCACVVCTPLLVMHRGGRRSHSAWFCYVCRRGWSGPFATPATHWGGVSAARKYHVGPAGDACVARLCRRRAPGVSNPARRCLETPLDFHPVSPSVFRSRKWVSSRPLGADLGGVPFRLFWSSVPRFRPTTISVPISVPFSVPCFSPGFSPAGWWPFSKFQSRPAPSNFQSRAFRNSVPLPLNHISAARPLHKIQPRAPSFSPRRRGSIIPFGAAMREYVCVCHLGWPWPYRRRAPAACALS